MLPGIATLLQGCRFSRCGQPARSYCCLCMRVCIPPPAQLLPFMLWLSCFCGSFLASGNPFFTKLVVGQVPGLKLKAVLCMGCRPLTYIRDVLSDVVTLLCPIEAKANIFEDYELKPAQAPVRHKGSRLVALLLCVSLKEDGKVCSSCYQAFHILQEKTNRIKITVNS